MCQALGLLHLATPSNLLTHAVVVLDLLPDMYLQVRLPSQTKWCAEHATSTTRVLNLRLYRTHPPVRHRTRPIVNVVCLQQSVPALWLARLIFLVLGRAVGVASLIFLSRHPLLRTIGAAMTPQLYSAFQALLEQRKQLV